MGPSPQRLRRRFASATCQCCCSTPTVACGATGHKKNYSQFAGGESCDTMSSEQSQGCLLIERTSYMEEIINAQHNEMVETQCIEMRHMFLKLNLENLERN